MVGDQKIQLFSRIKVHVRVELKSFHKNIQLDYLGQDE